MMPFLDPFAVLMPKIMPISLPKTENEHLSNSLAASLAAWLRFQLGCAPLIAAGIDSKESAPR
jgi:hypothetical protein